jgi:Xaa-Pro aminopeptidase
MTKERLNALRTRMAKEKLDGFLITDLANIRYLVGFSGDNGMVLLTKNRCLFFCDFRFQEQAKREIKNAIAKIRNRDLYAVFPTEELKGIRSLGFEAENLSYRNYLRVKKQIKKVKFVPCENWTYELRTVKDNNELKLIRKAVVINDAVFVKILDRIKPGVREKDLAAEIDYLITQQGEVAFPTIVGAGRNGALPHYQPGMKRLKKGEAVVFDFGTKYQGYCSDMTRTVFAGKADKKGKEIYSIVLEAQMRAIAAMKKGEKVKDIDAKARDFITEKGYGKYFGHGLGHGVGLLVHEGPALAKTSKAILNINNVVTVEPGIYLPDWGGVRIEDLVRVTENGCEILTKSPKELIEV